MEPLTEEENRQYLALDPADPAQLTLSGFAGRIAKLLNTPAARTNPDLCGSLDDFLGAVYALIQAKHHDFTDRTGPIEIAVVKKRAADIFAGRVRTDGKWIAGFYFNNALFRTAAVQHRILKIICGKDDSVPKLQKAAKVLFPAWTSGKLDLVHSQVNDLKHTPRGVHDQRTVTYADAVNAAGELLDLIEAWTAVPSAPTP